jgi:uncharacterized protein
MVVGAVGRHLGRAALVGAVLALTLAALPASAQAVSTPIHDIQGAGHISPINGQLVSGVTGVVTARAANGFYL